MKKNYPYDNKKTNRKPDSEPSRLKRERVSSLVYISALKSERISGLVLLLSHIRNTKVNNKYM